MLVRGFSWVVLLVSLTVPAGAALSARGERDGSGKTHRPNSVFAGATAVEGAGRYFRHGLLSAAAVAVEDPALYKAYYLEHQEENFAEAKRLYEQVLAAKPDETTQAAARAGAERCRDRLFADNFAALMPANAVAYVEITRPGALIEEIAGLLGLTGPDVQALLAERPSRKSPAPFYVPERFIISPALLRHLESFGGLAVALTRIRPDGPPTGVAVVHHGDADLVKGALETLFQFAPTGEKVRGMATAAVNFEGLSVTAVLTESLLIVGNSRELVEGVVARLQGEDVSSLASRKDLAQAMAKRAGATVFAFADLRAMLKIAKDEAARRPRDRAEFERINALLDLDSLRTASFAFGIRDGACSAEVSVALDDGHQCLAYDFLRLTPLTRSSLSCVPGSAAAVAAAGLNPPIAAAAPSESTGRSSVSAMDLGRELFWNVREISAFVIPGASMRVGSGRDEIRIPSAGVVFAVNDPGRSKAVWGRLLSVPGMFLGGEAKPPKETTIGETPVTRFAMPEGGELFLAQLGDNILIASTRDTVKAAIRARSRQASVLDDAVMKKTFERMPADACVLGVLHVGRVPEVAAPLVGKANRGGMTSGPGAAVVAHVKDLCRETVVYAALAQSPTQMSVTCGVSGLPNVNEALKRFGPLVNTLAGMIDVQAERREAPAAEQRARAVAAEEAARRRPRPGESRRRHDAE